MIVGSNSPPWDDIAKRIVIFSTDYLDFDGNYCIGGRQRFIRDQANVIRDWGRDVVIVQKARKSFEKPCPDGIPVIGLQSNLRQRYNFRFWKKAKSIAREGDVFVYASGDDVGFNFLPNAKAVQHGIKFDGPIGRGTTNIMLRKMQEAKSLHMAKVVRSLLCVDTNFINWVRMQGRDGYELANKCVYIPNYADINRIPTCKIQKSPHLSIISARRNTFPRGLDLFVEALSLLRKRNISFNAHISTNTGHDELMELAKKGDFDDYFTCSADCMDEVLERYQNFNVAVVPTRFSEGTSLACVEAIAAGLAIVSTPVGGLGNLVLPDFNGYVVSPTAVSIADALTELSNSEKRLVMQSNSLSMRDSLGIENWRHSMLNWLKQ